MIDPVQRLEDRARRFFCVRTLPDIVDLLEGRATEVVDGATVAVPPLQIRDKDSDYRGPFSTERAPDLREILRSAVSPEIESTVVVGPAQSYKTTLLLGVAGYHVKADPGGLAWVFGTGAVAKTFSQKRLQETINATPWLAALKDPAAWKDLELAFEPCTIRLAGSNSPGNLATFPYKRVIGDEVDKYPLKLRKEAGALELLTLRTEQVARFNHIFVSTPTTPLGPIWQAALQGDCRRYHVPCRSCGHKFVQTLDLLRFDLEHTPSGGVKWDKLRKSARMVCPQCGAEHFENHRRDMLENGEWIPDPVEVADAERERFGLVADPRRRSYLRSCFNVLHPNRTFARIAEKHVKAGKDPEKRQNFTNGELGEVFDPHRGEKIEAKGVEARAEAYLGEDAPPPNGQPVPRVVATPLLPHTAPVLVLVAGVDVQDDRLEVEVVAYGPGEETWGVQYSVIPGVPQAAETWDRLDALLARPWLHPLGYTLTPAARAIDTGNATEECYRYVQRCMARGIKAVAVKGSSGGYGEPVLFRPRKSGVKAVPLWMVGTITAKDWVYSRLRMTEAGPGYMHFPANPKRGYDPAYFRGLTSETRVEKRVGNRRVVQYVKPSGRRNEPLDVRVYAHAAFTFLNPDWDGLAKKVRAITTPPPPVPDPFPVVNATPAPPADHGPANAVSAPAQVGADHAGPEFDPATGAVVRPDAPPPAVPLQSPGDPTPAQVVAASPDAPPPTPVPPEPPPAPAPNTYQTATPAAPVQKAPLFRAARARRNWATGW